jgi:hypothetical protein
MTDVQRSIRRARTIRVVAVPAAALGALLLAVTLIAGSPLTPVLASAQAVCIAVLLVLIITQTRVMRTLQRRQRELNRPRMTPEDYRQLREMEIELGWEPIEPACDCGKSQEEHAREWDEQVREQVIASQGIPPLTATGSMSAGPAALSGTGSLSAPMTGPGGRWRPVSELPERDARVAEHDAILAAEGRESCIVPSYCPVCAKRAAGSEIMRKLTEWGQQQ